MTRNYRRGLNRIYLVLTAGWVLFLLAWTPFYNQIGKRKFSMDADGIVLRSCREDGDQFPPAQRERWNDKCLKQYDAALAKDDKIPYFSYGGAFWWLLLFTIAVPLVVYAILYGVYLLGRWLALGFRPTAK